MIVEGDNWPSFLYAGNRYDPEDVWKGLLRGHLLVLVCYLKIRLSVSSQMKLVQGYKFVFTSLSSVEKEVKSTRSGNARIHGMTRVTPGSIAYIATQVRSNAPFPISYSCSANYSRRRFVSRCPQLPSFPDLT